MKISVLSRFTLAAAATLVWSLLASGALALDPAKPPSGNFDLLGWYLNTPEDDGGDFRQVNLHADRFPKR